jgi:hypothetical protein
VTDASELWCRLLVLLNILTEFAFLMALRTVFIVPI